MKEKIKKTSFETWFRDWKEEISEYKYLIMLSLIILVLAEIATFYTSTYVDRINVVAVPDLILDNIPTLNLEIIYSYGMMLLLVTVLLYSFIFKVKEFHIISLQFCLLILVRSIFITLTHLGVPTEAITVSNAPNAFMVMNFHNDLFFSGHAALPFMAFLIFRKEAIGIFFLILTIILSTTVLLMHVHYTIDVFAAFFITYGVYKFCEWFISKGYPHKKTNTA